MFSADGLQSTTSDIDGSATVAAKLCVAFGCNVQLDDAMPKYCKQRRLCPEHLKAPALKRKGHGEKLWRFCQQCGKLEPLHAFDGTKRNCRVQLAKRRASPSSKSASALATSGADSLLGNSSNSMLTPLGGGIRKASSCSRTLNKLALQTHLNLLPQPQQQVQVLASAQSQLQQQAAQEQAISGRLAMIKQQLASMEQQVVLLQQQQQAEAQLAAMQQHHYKLLQQHMQSHAAHMQAVHLSGSSTLLQHSSGSLAAFAAAAGAASGSAGYAASAPIPSVPDPFGNISFVPIMGGTQGWPATAAGAEAGISTGAGMGSDRSLPPRNGRVVLAQALAPLPGATAGLSAPVPRLGSIPGSRAGSNSSQPLKLLHPAAAHHELLGMGSGAAARSRHTHVMHFEDLLLEDNDIPDLEDFLAAGASLQAVEHSSTQNVELTSSTSNALDRAASSTCHAPMGAHAVAVASAHMAADAGTGPVFDGFLDAAWQASAAHQTTLRHLAPTTWTQPALTCYASRAAAVAAAAGVNVFDSRRPANTSTQNKPGRSSLDMFTGLLEEVLAEIHAEHHANEAAAVPPQSTPPTRGARLTQAVHQQGQHLQQQQ